MSTFDHASLIQGINESLSSLRKTQPEAMRGFGQLAQASMVDGAISAKHKELMALAIGITQRCSGCIGFHTKALARLGASTEEVHEALGVAIYMGGGPVAMYAANAVAAFDEFASAPQA